MKILRHRSFQSREETERMIRLVNDLLQLSKMDNETEQIRNCRL